MKGKIIERQGIGTFGRAGFRTFRQLVIPKEEITIHSAPDGSGLYAHRGAVAGKIIKSVEVPDALIAKAKEYIKIKESLDSFEEYVRRLIPQTEKR